MATFIGIDLGTTFSAAAQIDETGRPVIVHNDEGHNITPSCITEREDGVMEVGEYARRMYGNAPDTAAARFKRDMGTSKTHTINGKDFTPKDLSAFVLKKMKKIAEEAVGEISETVVTIPANFPNEAREETLAAGKAAGLEINYIINEPTAAALHYAFKSGDDLGGIYAVYDLGGGTFDVSIIQVDGHNVEVLASNGVARLGGDDFDEAMLDLVRTKYEKETGESIDPEDFTKNDAEEEKKSLSGRKRSTAKIGRQLIDISREEFEEAISSRVTQAEMLCEATLDEAGLEPNDIRGVFLAGGSTRIPIVQESVKRVFKQDPISSVNVDEVVALGAALYAAHKGDHENLSSVQKTRLKKLKYQNPQVSALELFHLDMTVLGINQRLLIVRSFVRVKKSLVRLLRIFCTVRDGQDVIECKVTESTAPESDPRFVNIIWEGTLAPSSRKPVFSRIFSATLLVASKTA